ncbi:hypothetical protein [Congregicoccus parvus]|uniref:hypothetical protein n=1 Tax=Congregicoccus parvus TaxID=3081749 RepID=UPI003FA53895
MTATPSAMEARPTWKLDTALFKTPPHQELRRAAAEHGIESESLRLERTVEEARVGDTVSALVTLIEPRETRQWLVELALAEIVRDRSAEARAPLVLHSMTGREIVFDTGEARVATRTLGPLSMAAAQETFGSSVRIEGGTAVVNHEFLALGFDGACRAMSKLKRARLEGRLGEEEKFAFGVRPFGDDARAVGRAIAERAGLTAEDERAFAATFPALTTYVDLVSRTKGLSDILQVVVERPSWWAIVRRFGRMEWSVRFESGSVEVLEPVRVGLPPGISAHQLPFTLLVNERPVLECMLLVVPAHPPLLTSAGIVGLVARRPGNDERRLVVRVLSARRGDAAPAVVDTTGG